jgi:hypothetical protein
LITFYYAPDTAPNWREVGDIAAIGPGSLEVGLTTATTGELIMEGHFDWVVLRHVGTLPSDGCSTVLEGVRLDLLMEQ